MEPPARHSQHGGPERKRPLATLKMAEVARNRAIGRSRWRGEVGPHSRWRTWQDRDRGVPIAACCHSPGSRKSPAPLTPPAVFPARETRRKIMLKAPDRRRSRGGSGSRKDRRLREGGGLKIPHQRWRLSRKWLPPAAKMAMKAESRDATPKMALWYDTYLTFQRWLPPRACALRRDKKWREGGAVSAECAVQGRGGNLRGWSQSKV